MAHKRHFSMKMHRLLPIATASWATAIPVSSPTAGAEPDIGKCVQKEGSASSCTLTQVSTSANGLQTLDPMKLDVWSGGMGGSTGADETRSLRGDGSAAGMPRTRSDQYDDKRREPEEGDVGNANPVISAKKSKLCKHA